MAVVLLFAVDPISNAYLTHNLRVHHQITDRISEIRHLRTYKRWPVISGRSADFHHRCYTSATSAIECTLLFTSPRLYCLSTHLSIGHVPNTVQPDISLPSTHKKFLRLNTHSPEIFVVDPVHKVSPVIHSSICSIGSMELNVSDHTCCCASSR